MGLATSFVSSEASANAISPLLQELVNQHELNHNVNLINRYYHSPIVPMTKNLLNKIQANQNICIVPNLP